MEYHINLGVWSSVFAVPSEIVDKHIKLAGAAQLKVILWILRHAGENFTVKDIADTLKMQEADVKDCIQYWVQTGVIAVNHSIIEPVPLTEPTETEMVYDTEDIEKDTEEEKKDDLPAEKITDKSAKKRAVSRPQKPDLKYLGLRMQEDKNVAFLMNKADEIFGRMTSTNDKATLLLIHEYDGLPIEVIIMMMQYALDIGKCNMRYIEKMAVTWAEEEITTLELAEKKIKSLTNGRNAAKIVQRTIGQDEHSPTEQETAFADLWLNKWKFGTDMIREAYERCINQKGKYIAKYVNSILERWYYSGISTIEQAENESENKKTKPKESYGATYDISEYESTSVVDEEW